ncbi:MAG: dihydroorotase family protein [Candidatus Bathyarchaeota archaeon]|nr:dihydroorotase family protein [Candidatus Bathyarchaeota archaeon]MDW8040098.1 dihydroorotase family protein [Nitrososphaerota archaeon]
MTVDLVLKDLKAYIDGAVQECCIAVENGTVHKVGKEAQMPKADTVLSLNGLLVLPGLIDVHVHLRDEGKAYKEDFYTGTAAAAAGGFTTVLDMPNNTPVTMSVETLENRMANARGKILVNVGFYSEFPKDPREIEKIIAGGAVAFKLYLGEQVGGLNIDDDHALKYAFKTVASRVPIAVHAEDKNMLKRMEEELKGKGRNDIEAFLEAHSERAEASAVRRLVKIAEKTSAKVHFCHISTKQGLEIIHKAKEKGLALTCEVTPHHLFLSVDDLKRVGTVALTAPPLRDKSHVDFLWKSLKNGLIDVVGSDHAPHTLAEKSAASVWEVKVGIPGLETTLPLMLTAVNSGALSLGDVVRMLAENPARVFKLKGRGAIKEGGKADFVAVDMGEEYCIDASKFHSKAKFSPFNGKRVKGKPVKTFVAGQLVVDRGEIVAEAGCGKIILGEG